jgi:hypothetical protein
MIGWLAALCFALCAVPLAWDGIRGRSERMNPFFLTLWTAGEVFGCIYTFDRADWPLFTNYTVNLGCLLLYYRGLPQE